MGIFSRDELWKGLNELVEAAEHPEKRANLSYWALYAGAVAIVNYQIRKFREAEEVASE